MIDPELIGWYLTSSKNISMFVQLKGLFVRQIEIKTDYPKGGKNTRSTWAADVLNKLEAEAELEDVRIKENGTSRSKLSIFEKFRLEALKLKKKIITRLKR